MAFFPERTAVGYGVVQVLDNINKLSHSSIGPDAAGANFDAEAPSLRVNGRTCPMAELGSHDQSACL